MKMARGRKFCIYEVEDCTIRVAKTTALITWSALLFWHLQNVFFFFVVVVVVFFCFFLFCFLFFHDVTHLCAVPTTVNSKLFSTN